MDSNVTLLGEFRLEQIFECFSLAKQFQKMILEKKWKKLHFTPMCENRFSVCWCVRAFGKTTTTTTTTVTTTTATTTTTTPPL